MRRPQARHPCGSSSARRPGPSVTLMLKTRCTRRPRLTDCWAAARCDSYASAIASKWSSSVRLHLTSVAGRCRSRRRSAVAKPRCLEVPWASQAYSVVVVGFVLAADEAFLTSCRREAVAVVVPSDDATYSRLLPHLLCGLPSRPIHSCTPLVHTSCPRVSSTASILFTRTL